MNIRLAQREDLPRIIEIYNQSIPGRQSTADMEPVSVEERIAWFDKHTPDGRPIWVAEVDGIVAGWLDLTNYKDRVAYHPTVEFGLYIASEFQRRGIARALLTHAISQAEQLGIINFVGVIFGHNEPSIRLVKSLGFELWGTLPRVTEMNGSWYDVVIYGLSLADH